MPQESNDEDRDLDWDVPWEGQAWYRSTYTRREKQIEAIANTIPSGCWAQAEWILEQDEKKKQERKERKNGKRK